MQKHHIPGLDDSLVAADRFRLEGTEQPDRKVDAFLQVQFPPHVLPGDPGHRPAAGQTTRSHDQHLQSAGHQYFLFGLNYHRKIRFVDGGGGVQRRLAGLARYCPRAAVNFSRVP